MLVDRQVALKVKSVRVQRDRSTDEVEEELVLSV